MNQPLLVGDDTGQKCRRGPLRFFFSALWRPRVTPTTRAPLRLYKPCRSLSSKPRRKVISRSEAGRIEVEGFGFRSRGLHCCVPLLPASTMSAMKFCREWYARSPSTLSLNADPYSLFFLRRLPRSQQQHPLPKGRQGAEGPPLCLPELRLPSVPL